MEEPIKSALWLSTVPTDTEREMMQQGKQTSIFLLL